jgi:hypothetical protein
VTIDRPALEKLSDENRERIRAAGDPEAIRRREELEVLAKTPEFWKDLPSGGEQLRKHVENLEDR